MMTLLSILLLGFFLGMRHATDVDHVLAVTIIVSREKSVHNAAIIGALWGVGHSLTLLLVGGAIIFFGLVIPPRLGLSLEFAVGVMLVLLGLANFRSFVRWVRGHAVQPGGTAQPPRPGRSHGHPAEEKSAAWLERKLGPLGACHAIRPLLVGVVHGLAGSAAVALLVLPIIQHAGWAVAYLSIFGVGTIAGMMLMTAAVALPFVYSVSRSAAFNRRLGGACCLLSVAFGVFLMYQIGVEQGLFSFSP